MPKNWAFLLVTSWVQRVSILSVSFLSLFRMRSSFPSVLGAQPWVLHMQVSYHAVTPPAFVKGLETAFSGPYCSIPMLRSL